MRQSWQMWSEGLSSDLVAKIIRTASKKKRKTAVSKHTSTSFPGARVSEVAWLTDQDWLRDILYRYVTEANRNAFGVDVQNYADIQYTEYHGSERGQYHWHNDVFWDQQKPFDRKISITVQLSDPEDYVGGTFEFNDCPSPENARAKGTVLVFPSYLDHRVAPVTEGVRKSLVAWFEGPRWR